MALVVFICLCWGFNQLAIKLAIHDVPPLHAMRDPLEPRDVMVLGLMRLRGLPVSARRHADRGARRRRAVRLRVPADLSRAAWTTASRAVLFIYLAPFFVVIGARWFLPGDRFGLMQWAACAGLHRHGGGLRRAGAGVDPAPDARRSDDGRAALAWAATTLVIKASALARVSPEKTLLYQLVVCAPIVAFGALVFGERIAAMPSAVALGSLAYQTIVVGSTFSVWFALIVKFSASRLSAFTFLTPLFGVAAGHFVLGEPLTPAFALAVALVAAGLILVNRPR